MAPLYTGSCESRHRLRESGAHRAGSGNPASLPQFPHLCNGESSTALGHRDSEREGKGGRPWGRGTESWKHGTTQRAPHHVGRTHTHARSLLECKGPGLRGKPAGAWFRVSCACPSQQIATAPGGSHYIPFRQGFTNSSDLLPLGGRGRRGLIPTSQAGKLRHRATK